MISQRKRGGGTIAFKNQILWLGLSKTTLVLAPPGHTRVEANDLIKSTHKPVNEAPLKAGAAAKASAKKSAARKKSVSKKAAPKKAAVKKKAAPRKR